MGHSCTPRNVVLILAALETILSDNGFAVTPGAALAAAAGLAPALAADEGLEGGFGGHGAFSCAVSRWLV